MVARPRTDDVFRRVDTFSDARGIRIEEEVVVDLRPDADPTTPVPPARLWRTRAAEVVEDLLEVDAVGRDPRRGSA